MTFLVLWGGYLFLNFNLRLEFKKKIEIKVPLVPFFVRKLKLKKSENLQFQVFQKVSKNRRFSKNNPQRGGSLENVIDLTILRIFGRTGIIY